jgi:hypothetical protein
MLLVPEAIEDGLPSGGVTAAPVAVAAVGADEPALASLHQVQIMHMRYPVNTDNQPRWLGLASHGQDLFLPLFSTEELFVSVCQDLDLPIDRYGQVTDGYQFVSSVPARMPDGRRVRIVIDLQMRDGSVSFLELQRPHDLSLFTPPLSRASRDGTSRVLPRPGVTTDLADVMVPQRTS